MSAQSKIEWTETTWNPVTGCTEVSPGCANCYARGMSKRLAAMARADEAKGNNPGKKAAYKLSVLDDGRWSGVVTPVPGVLRDPLGWKKPRHVFVNSMSDLFWGTEADLKVARQHGAKDPRPVPFDFIDRVFAVMALTPQHTYQILTKRPERMAEYLATAQPRDPSDSTNPNPFYREHAVIESIIVDLNRPTSQAMTPGPNGYFPWPLPNVWLGTSVENQAMADARIPHLLNCPAAVRWLSCEPLLGAVDLRLRHQVLTDLLDLSPDRDDRHSGTYPFGGLPEGAITRRHHWVHWVVVGGESGSKARPFNIAWARSIIQQCRKADVPCFVKQLGADAYSDEQCFCGRNEDGSWKGPAACWNCGGRLLLVNKKGGDPAEWPEDLRVREFPAVEGVNRA